MVLHDWSDDYARKILLRLREAAVVGRSQDRYKHKSGNAKYESSDEGDVQETILIIADHVLPLACVDDNDNRDEFAAKGEGGDGEAGVEDVEGAESVLAPPPLLANLGKASANAYWMDMTVSFFLKCLLFHYLVFHSFVSPSVNPTSPFVLSQMQVTFNGKERTLREIVMLARSAGWKVTKMTRAQGSLFGHIVAVPAAIPAEAGVGGAEPEESESESKSKAEADARTAPSSVDQRDEGDHLDSGYSADGSAGISNARSRPATPMFGSSINLPSVAWSSTRGDTSQGSRNGRWDGSGQPINGSQLQLRGDNDRSRKNLLLHNEDEISMGIGKKVHRGGLMSFIPCYH